MGGSPILSPVNPNVKINRASTSYEAQDATRTMPTFRWEEDLGDSFLAETSAAAWAPRARYELEHVLRECSWSDGRADAVWAGIRGRLLEASVAQILRDPVASRIVATLRPRSPRTEESLLSSSGVTRSTFRPVLGRVLELGIATVTDSGSFLLGEAYSRPSIELCAFEFKLKDWRRAFYQALRYRSFAHRVYVVMPESHARLALGSEDRFKTFGVGLIAHGFGGKSSILVRSPKNRPRSPASLVRAIADFATALA